MSALTSLARVLAAEAGRAQPLTTVRHIHVADWPLVLIPLKLAGEAGAPLAVMIGRTPQAPSLLVVPEPRNRDDRFAFAAALSRHVQSYLEGYSSGGDAPQLWVPNPAGVEFLRLLGRSTRFRSTEGPYAVLPGIPQFGRWLTFFAEQADLPGSSLLLAATALLGRHWATGQSALEDGNLATLLAWIDPPSGMDGLAAAREAERYPPAGPATDPEFDKNVLWPALEHAEPGELETALRGQLEPTWRSMWQAISLMRTLPPGESVSGRWERDIAAFRGYAQYLTEGGLPQPRRDSAVAAARRLAIMEQRQTLLEAEQALDDPLLLAEARMTGEAFRGRVIDAQPDRIDSSGKRRKLRPHITVRTTDSIRLEPGTTVVSPSRTSQKAAVISVSSVDGRLDLVLELSGGMGRSLTAPPGTVPSAGELVSYTSLVAEFMRGPEFPPPEETPWTHGGPPRRFDPDHEDVNEAWS